MKEYTEHIKAYEDHWSKFYSTLLSPEDWGDKVAAERYLEKYWLTLEEYESHVKGVQNRIFIPNARMPAMMFRDEYELTFSRGGCLFVEADFRKFQECVRQIGESHFFVIEDTFGGNLDEPAFRMKFPGDISWSELVSGNYISSMILNADHKQYYVLGETENWGRYAANDADSPLDVTGFLPQYATLFREKLKLPDREQKEILSWLPTEYRNKFVH